MSTVESDQTPQRRGLYHRCFRTGYLRARGLGVMMSPSHGEDRRFNSGRAHQLTSEAELLQPRTICLDLVCSLAPVQFRPSPPVDFRGGIAPAKNNLLGLEVLFGAGSIPAEPTS